MEKINEAVKYIQSIYPEKPSVGIVLGSGLGSFTNEIKIEKEIAYGDIPNFPVSTVKGDSGKLIFGEFMIINDHHSLLAPNPLIGNNNESLGPRFPDMSEPYKKYLINKAKQIALKNNIDVKEGVYVSVTGPTFETKAEYHMINVLGGDAVGMSTVQEVIAAVHMDLPVFAISVITDIGIREGENKITHEEVLQAAKEAEPKLACIFKELIALL